MSGKTILITGGAGFIGANFINQFFESYPHYKIVNLDKLTYAADLKNIIDPGVSQYEFVEGDINDSSLLQKLFEQHNFSGVINFAAESHVDNSIKGPEEFVKTNLNGTFNLLHRSYLQWMDGPHQVKAGYEHCRFHQISTDEVYGSLGATGLFSEKTAYAPNSPYSATKAGADFLVRSYFHTFGLNVVTTNCSNNYGPFQNREKLIPVIIEKALSNKAIPIYGDGKNIRDWLFVRDHCSAICSVFFKGSPGETYNIGGDEEKTNLDLCHTICNLLDEVKPRTDGENYAELIEFVSDRPGHDRRYAIDHSKLTSELGWQPNYTFEQGIRETVLWYVDRLSAG